MPFTILFIEDKKLNQNSVACYGDLAFEVLQTLNDVFSELQIREWSYTGILGEVYLLIGKGYRDK